MAQEPLYSLIEAVLVHIYFRCTGFECEYTGKKINRSERGKSLSITSLINPCGILNTLNLNLIIH